MRKRFRVRIPALQPWTFFRKIQIYAFIYVRNLVKEIYTPNLFHHSYPLEKVHDTRPRLIPANTKCECNLGCRIDAQEIHSRVTARELQAHKLAERMAGGFLSCRHGSHQEEAITGTDPRSQAPPESAPRIAGRGRVDTDSTGGRLNRTQAFVSKYELGERSLDVFDLIAVCDATGVTLQDFSRRFDDLRRQR